MFASGVDTSATETKGTVLIHSAEQVYLEEVLHGITIVSIFHLSLSCLAVLFYFLCPCCR